MRAKASSPPRAHTTGLCIGTDRPTAFPLPADAPPAPATPSPALRSHLLSSAADSRPVLAASSYPSPSSSPPTAWLTPSPSPSPALTQLGCSCGPPPASIVDPTALPLRAKAAAPPPSSPPPSAPLPLLLPPAALLPASPEPPHPISVSAVTVTPPPTPPLVSERPTDAPRPCPPPPPASPFSLTSSLSPTSPLSPAPPSSPSSLTSPSPPAPPLNSQRIATPSSLTGLPPPTPVLLPLQEAAVRGRYHDDVYESMDALTEEFRRARAHVLLTQRVTRQRVQRRRGAREVTSTGVRAGDVMLDFQQPPPLQWSIVPPGCDPRLRLPALPAPCSALPSVSFPSAPYALSIASARRLLQSYRPRPPSLSPHVHTALTMLDLTVQPLSAEAPDTPLPLTALLDSQWPDTPSTTSPSPPPSRFPSPPLAVPCLPYPATREWTLAKILERCTVWSQYRYYRPSRFARMRHRLLDSAVRQRRCTQPYESQEEAFERTRTDKLRQQAKRLAVVELAATGDDQLVE